MIKYGICNLTAKKLVVFCLSDTLSAGNELLSNEVLRSKDGRFVLVLQQDQNLLLYNTTDNEPVWASETKDFGTIGTTRAVMQADGNFVLKAGDIISLGY